MSFPDLDINNQDVDGNTALHMVYWKYIPEFLSYEGIMLDIQNKKGYTVLYLYLQELDLSNCKSTKGSKWYGFVQQIIA